MQGNIRIVLTLSILKKKDTVTTDCIENKINKINKVHNAYLCFIEFKVGNWSEKKNSTVLFTLFTVSDFIYTDDGHSQVRNVQKFYLRTKFH